MTLIVILIATIVVVVLLGQIFLRYSVEGTITALPNGMVEAMLGVVGTLFSVLLGLLVAGAIQNYEGVRAHVENEANSIADVFRYARGLPDPDRTSLRQLCRRYTSSIIQEEWPAMRDKKSSDETWALSRELWDRVVSITPRNDRETNLVQAILAANQELAENRRARLAASTSALSPFLWGVIIFGALVTVLFTYFFTTKLGPLHNILTGLVAVSLALNIWLLAAYNSPFGGELQIQPVLLRLLEQRVLDDSDDPSPFLAPEKSAPHTSPIPASPAR